MKRELEEPLAAFAGGSKERRKIIQNGIERLHKTKIQQTQTVNKVISARCRGHEVILSRTDSRSLRARLLAHQRLPCTGAHGDGP